MEEIKEWFYYLYKVLVTLLLLNKCNKFIDRFDAQDRKLETLEKISATLVQKVDSLTQIISNNSCTQGQQGLIEVNYLQLLK